PRTLSTIQMTPRPPCPPLFPYTTLFRSRRHRLGHLPGHGADDAARPPHPDEDARGTPSGDLTDMQRAALMLVLLPSLLPCGPARDRKSTRLNSSHVSISYAVFCLKKKKL